MMIRKGQDPLLCNDITFEHTPETLVQHLELVNSALYVRVEFNDFYMYVRRLCLCLHNQKPFWVLGTYM